MEQEGGIGAVAPAQIRARPVPREDGARWPEVSLARSLTRPIRCACSGGPSRCLARSRLSVGLTKKSQRGSLSVGTRYFGPFSPR